MGAAARVQATLVLLSLFAAVCFASSFLAYGPPTAKVSTGFSLFQSPSLDQLPIQQGQLLAAPRIHGLLVGRRYIVVFGQFSWEWSSSTLESNYLGNLAVFDLSGEQSGFAGFSPSVFGYSVDHACWREQDDSFFVIGQLRGLDATPQGDNVGVAQCSISSRSCGPVGEGLESVPLSHSPSSIAWSDEQNLLAVLWTAHTSKSVTFATWNPATGWFVRRVQSNLVATTFMSQNSIFLAFGSQNFYGDMGSWLCFLPPHPDQNFGILQSTSGPDQCWTLTTFPESPDSFNQISHAVRVSASEVFVLGQDSTPAWKVIDIGSKKSLNVTYNLNSIVPSYGNPMDTYHLFSGGRGRAFILVQRAQDCNPSQTVCPATLAVFENNWWRAIQLQLCGFASTLSNYDPTGLVGGFPLFADFKGELIYWTCPLSSNLQGYKSAPDTKIYVLNVTSGKTEAVAKFDKLYRAAYVDSMCEAGRSVWIFGDMIGVGVPGSAVLPVSGSVLWSLGSSVWTDAQIPFLAANPSVRSCRSIRDQGDIWTVYSANLDGSRSLGVGLFSSVNNRLSFWTPSVKSVVLFSDTFVSFQTGPAYWRANEQEEYLLMPMTVFQTGTNIPNLIVMRWRIPADGERVSGFSNTSSSWEPFVTFTGFSGLQVFISGIDYIGSNAFVFGSFNVLSGNVTQINIVQFSLATGEQLLVDSIDPSQASFFVVNDAAYGSPDGPQQQGMWFGGLISSLPGLDNVANVACLSVPSGKWIASTVQLDSPPSFGIVTTVLFDWTQENMILLSGDFNPHYRRFFSGINVFFSGQTAPDPSVNFWVPAITQIANVDLRLTAPTGDIVLIVAITLGIVVVVSLLIFLIWRAGARRSFRYIEIPDYGAHGVQTNLDAIMRDNEIVKIDTEDVVLGDIIGQGGQGTVRRAKFKGQDVAAKAVADFSQNLFVSFLKEVKMLASIKHPNIVEFIGILVKEMSIYMVTELMDADLLSILDQLDTSMRIQISIDIASAVEYLHSFEPPILHRDLKPSNILVSRDGRVKLTDFGVSRLMADSAAGQMTRDAGTLLFMAPEIWMGEGGYGTAADVYSYGLVLIEVWTGKNAFSPHEFTWILQFMERFRAGEVVPGVANLPPSCPQVIRHVAEDSVSFDPDERPTMTEICKLFRKNFSRFLGEGMVVLHYDQPEKHKRGRFRNSDPNNRPKSSGSLSPSPNSSDIPAPAAE